MSESDRTVRFCFLTLLFCLVSSVKLQCTPTMLHLGPLFILQTRAVTLIPPSLTLSVSCQNSLPIAAAVHSPSVNSPSNQLSTSSPYFVFVFLLFCTPVFLAHPHLHIYHSSVNCNYFTTIGLFISLPRSFVSTHCTHVFLLCF